MLQALVVSRDRVVGPADDDDEEEDEDDDAAAVADSTRSVTA